MVTFYSYVIYSYVRLNTTYKSLIKPVWLLTATDLRYSKYSVVDGVVDSEPYFDIRLAISLGFTFLDDPLTGGVCPTSSWRKAFFGDWWC